jgi:2,4-dienoyl-CoA reductase-like NADH-dependent reductase (Old Yellow Enzyme family)
MAGPSGEYRDNAMPGLFDTYEVRGLTLKNRIVMPPMCM